MKIRSLSAGILTATLAVAVSGGVWAAHRSDAEQAIAEAKALQAQAAAAGIETGETAKLIEEAQALLPSRQYTKAMELATKAAKQDQFAIGRASATATAAPAADAKAAAEAEQAIAAAEAARKKAAAIGGEWRDTANMIAQASELAKTGDFAGAVKLATTAKR